MEHFNCSATFFPFQFPPLYPHHFPLCQIIFPFHFPIFIFFRSWISHPRLGLSGLKVKGEVRDEAQARQFVAGRPSLVSCRQHVWRHCRTPRNWLERGAEGVTRGACQVLSLVVKESLFQTLGLFSNFCSETLISIDIAYKPAGAFFTLLPFLLSEEISGSEDDLYVVKTTSCLKGLCRNSWMKNSAQKLWSASISIRKQQVDFSHYFLFLYLRK